MSKLKHTPWTVVSWNAVGDKTYYAIQNCKGLNFIDFLDEATAKAIAALPDTILDLENTKLKIERLELGVKHYKEENQQLMQRIEKFKAGTLRKTEMIGELQEAIIMAENKESVNSKKLEN